MQPTQSYVRAVGNRLEVDGHEFKFVGFNVRGLAHYGFNDFLPRSTVAQRTEVLAEAQAVGSLVVRIFLPFFTLSDAELISRLRIVLDNAVTYQQRVIVCLTDHFEAVKLQHWSFFQDPPDYPTYLYIDKHWNKVLNPDFYARLYRGPYLDYVRAVVSTFRNHPAVLAWELTNEGSNYPDNGGFINFCNAMAAEIRAVDPNHMISAGIVSTAVTQFKSEPGNDEPARLYENLDFVTLHDYDTISLVDLGLARRLNKPLIIEETGRTGQRENFFRENMAFWFDNGVSGYMGWGFMPSDFDNQDGDVNIGIDRIFHGDYDRITRLWSERGATLPPVPPPAPMTDEPGSPPPAPPPDKPARISLSASHNNVRVGNDNLLQALDGRPETRWSSGIAQRPGLWVEVDLGQVQAVSRLRLNNDRSPHDYPRGYIVRFSEDRTQWQEVARNDHNDQAVDITFKPRPARYLRIEQTGSSEQWWWSIHELDVSAVEIETNISASHNNVLSGADNLLQVLDERPETRWSTRLSQRPGMWFQYDLGEVQTISQIRLDNDHSPQDYPRGYAVKLSLDAQNWATVAGAQINDRPLNVIFSPSQARYIRIEQTGRADPWWWSIHGLEISGDIKISARASHNNVQSGADNILQALDGQPGTRWSTGAVQRPGMWFELDLGRVQPVSRVQLNNDASPRDYPRGYIVRLSEDRANWQEMARNDRNDRALDITFSPRQARYIRIEQTGTADQWWWSIHGVEISSDVKMSAGASHNNVQSGADNISQALDGQPDSRWSTQAVQQPGMWFEVDLGQIQLVNQLRLNNDASPHDYPRGFIVRLSEDRVHWQEVARNDRNDRALDITFSPRQARYIRIEQTGSADQWWWSIHEITVGR